MAIIHFSIEDLKNHPYDTERVLRRFETAINDTGNTAQANLDAKAKEINDTIAKNKPPVITPGAGIQVVQTPGHVTIIATGATGAAAGRGAVNFPPYLDGSPSVDVTGDLGYVEIANTSPTTILNLLNGAIGQTVVLRFLDGNTTVDHTQIRLTGGVDFQSTPNATLVLVQDNERRWDELSRSAPS